jgi:hypothetical protein
VVTASKGVGESAACWVGVTKNGQYAYVTNTASDSITVAYAIVADGPLAATGVVVDLPAGAVGLAAR